MRRALLVAAVAGVMVAGPVQGDGGADAGRKACVKRTVWHHGVKAKRRVCPTLHVSGRPHLPPNPPIIAGPARLGVRPGRDHAAGPL